VDFVTRIQRGAPAQKAAFKWVDSTQGVKIHYEGTDVPADLANPDQHHRCAERVNQIERSHLANTKEGYIAIAYTAMVCPHGTVYEGRGAHAKTGANGNSALNANHYAVCAMLGNTGLTEPTEPLLNGLRDAVEWLRVDGVAGPEIKGHRDGYATSCPGEPLYRWVQQGAPRPNITVPPAQPPQRPEPPAPPPQVPAWPGQYLKYQQPMLHNGAVQQWQQRMRDRGWAIDVDGWYGQQSDSICRRFQADKGLARDGVVGPATWAATFRTDNIT
jgi:hypothetical protein